MRRGLALRWRWLLIAAVLMAHGLMMRTLSDHLASRTVDAAMAPRLTTVYLRQLAPAEPPPAAAGARRASAPPEPDANLPVRRPAAASALAANIGTEEPDVAGAPARIVEPVPPVAEAASAPEADAAEPEPPVVADANLQPPAEPAERAADAGEAIAAPPFVWPPSTRISYALSGSYRGEIHGSAQVEWINAEPRYQVNLDVTIGLPFAPLLSRQMRSDGRLGPFGLQPQRYDQRSKTAFQEPRGASLRMHDRQVSTADGRPLPSVGGAAATTAADVEMPLQDSASQFVQLTWLFTTRPQLLVTGTTIAFPLALPGRVAAWRYRVGERQTLSTRFGPVEAFRVHSAPDLDKRGDLLAEAWFAPAFAYLPVRIRIEQDADVYLDLIIKELPEIAAREGAAPVLYSAGSNPTSSSPLPQTEP